MAVVSQALGQSLPLGRSVRQLGKSGRVVHNSGPRLARWSTSWLSVQRAGLVKAAVDDNHGEASMSLGSYPAHEPQPALTALERLGDDGLPEVEGNEIVLDVAKYVQALKDEEAAAAQPKIVAFDHDVYNKVLIEQLQDLPDKDLIVPIVRNGGLLDSCTRVVDLARVVAKGAAVALLLTVVARVYSPAILKGISGAVQAKAAKASVGLARANPKVSGQLAKVHEAALGAVAAVVSGLGVGGASLALDSMRKVRTIFKVQLALRGPVRLIRDELEKVGLRHDLATKDGMRSALWEGVDTVMKAPQLCSYFSSKTMTTAGNEEYTDTLELLCREVEVRACVTRTPLLGQVCRLDVGAQKPESEFMVVTIVAGMEGRVTIPEVRDWDSLGVALHKMCRMSNERIKHLDMLWVPRKNAEPYTEEEMLWDHPDMRALENYVEESKSRREAVLL